MLSYTVISVVLVFTLVIVNFRYFVINKFSSDYWQERENLVKNEEMRMMGGDLVLEAGEIVANEILMKAKRNEIDNACENLTEFLPSQNFLLVSEKIRQSVVFKIIKAMPKGSVLHAHNAQIVSADFMVSNITYRPNLYACEIDGRLKLQFFANPDDQCEWRLVEDIRKDGVDIDTMILKELTMDSREYGSVEEAWQKFLSIINFMYPIITYRPVYEDYVYQGLVEFYDDNILYAEIRTKFPNLYDLNGNEYGTVEAARIYKKMVDRFLQDHPDFVGVKLIYSVSRKCSEIELEQHLETARLMKKELPDFIAGFDIITQEYKGKPLIKFASILRKLGEDLPMFFHAGETNWYGTSIDENLIDAVMLNTKRIGHGFALLKHPRLMELVRARGIAIEVSPISNQVLALVRDLRNHPASALFADNYPVVVSNDDPSIWGVQGLSYDFYEAFVGIMSKRADLRALKKLALNSIDYSSMDENQKKKAMEIFNRRWNEFVTRLSSKLIP